MATTSTKRHYRLPFGGGTTTSQTRYFREWRKAARAVEKAFPGYKLDRFDPGFGFTCWQKDGSGDTISLSQQAVKCLLTGEKPRK